MKFIELHFFNGSKYNDCVADMADAKLALSCSVSINIDVISTIRPRYSPDGEYRGTDIRLKTGDHMNYILESYKWIQEQINDVPFDPDKRVTPRYDV